MGQRAVFESGREVLAFCLVCVLVLALNLGVSFYKFSKFHEKNHIILRAKLLQNYEKTNQKGKIYRVLKLSAGEFDFYTTTRADFAPENDKILISVDHKKVKFKDYLSGMFYMPNFGILEARYGSEIGGKFDDLNEAGGEFAKLDNDNADRFDGLGEIYESRHGVESVKFSDTSDNITSKFKNFDSEDDSSTAEFANLSGVGVIKFDESKFGICGSESGEFNSGKFVNLDSIRVGKFGSGKFDKNACDVNEIPNLNNINTELTNKFNENKFENLDSEGGNPTDKFTNLSGINIAKFDDSKFVNLDSIQAGKFGKNSRDADKFLNSDETNSEFADKFNENKFKTQSDQPTNLSHTGRKIWNKIANLPVRFSILNLRDKIYDFIADQHDDAKMRELYTALFLATPIGKELRTDVNFYGIAHLIAISGYHLGLIFGAFYFLLRPTYTFFQARRFPYRNAKFDLSVLIFAFLLFYLALIGFVPSFLRALLMSLLALYLLSKNVRILSFELLFIVVCAAVSLMPNLLFSVGFYFSCLGVFYIYLFLHHFGGRFSRFTSVVLLNFWVFSAMILPVLYFFPLISFQQFAVLFLTPLFSVFYPLSLVLHVFGVGDVFDESLLYFLNLRLYGVNLSVPFWLFLAYNVLSLASVKSKILATILVSLNLLCFMALF